MSLDALCSRFGIDTSERERHGHGALLDSRLLAEVFIELTGGAQAGLDFNALSSAGEAQASKKETILRPTALAEEVPAHEKAAHAEFIAEMAEPLWAKYQ